MRYCETLTSNSSGSDSLGLRVCLKDEKSNFIMRQALVGFMLALITGNSYAAYFAREISKHTDYAYDSLVHCQKPCCEICWFKGNAKSNWEAKGRGSCLVISPSPELGIGKESAKTDTRFLGECEKKWRFYYCNVWSEACDNLLNNKFFSMVDSFSYYDDLPKI